MVIEYDGSEFHGFQRQPGLRTVDQVIETGLAQLTGETNTVTGAGRTDAGVHALGQVVAFDTESTIPPDRFAPALNGILPEDIRVLVSEATADQFHPRYDAKSKMYQYLIYRERVGFTLYRRQAWQLTDPLNLEAMQTAAQKVVGFHDFRSFMASGSSVQNTERTVTLLDIAETRPWLAFTVAADGFLYHMVRNLVGTLILVGRGMMTPDAFAAVIAARDRTKAGPTAPAQGLYLVQVAY